MRKPLFHERILHKVRVAECLAELQEAGNLILSTELESDHVNVFYAWQDRWNYLKVKMANDPWCKIELEYLDNDFYNSVLDELRAQEERARERFLNKLQSCYRLKDELESIVRT